MVKIAVDEKRGVIYAHECFYRRGQSSDVLRSAILAHASSSDLIVADSADARLISDLSRSVNIRGAIKWKVRERIKKVQGYTIVITPTSKNLEFELINYLWSDKKAEVPVDEHNHLLDALGYAVTGRSSFKFSIS